MTQFNIGDTVFVTESYPYLRSIKGVRGPYEVVEGPDGPTYDLDEIRNNYPDPRPVGDEIFLKGDPENAGYDDGIFALFTDYVEAAPALKFPVGTRVRVINDWSNVLNGADPATIYEVTGNEGPLYGNDVKWLRDTFGYEASPGEERLYLGDNGAATSSGAVEAVA
jgi:hypothetical protein